MRRVLLLLALVLLVAAVAVTVGVRTWPSGGLDAGTVLARAEGQEDAVFAQLTEGKALHEVDTRYRRQGPAADQIRQMTTEWYLPERTVGEMWFEVGPGGAVTRVRGWVKDENDAVLQDISTVEGEVVTKDVASGAEMRRPLTSVEKIRASVQRSREFLDQALLRGKAVVSSQNAQTITVDQGLALPEPEPTLAPNSFSQGYSIPYTKDIEAVRRLSRTEVDAKTSRFLRWCVILVDAAGQERVVEEWQSIAFQVVDASEVPPGP